MDEFDSPPVVVFRLTDGLPVVPVRITVVDNELVIPAILRPDLPVSRIAPQWAEAVEMSNGAAMLACVFSGYDEAARGWGPSQMLTPDFDDSLSDRPIGGFLFGQDTVGGFLLGQDFLENVMLMFVGPARLFILGKPPEAEGSADGEDDDS